MKSLGQGVRAIVAMVATGSLLLTLRDVWARIRFPYDLLVWADDYFLTTVMRLRAGIGSHGPAADANSAIYSPGGPWLHYLLLSPFGVESSLFVNKLLAQFWLWLAIVLAGRVAWALYARGQEIRRWPALWLLTAVLGVIAYGNPVADSLHPVNLELLVIAATCGLGFGFRQASPRFRLMGLAALPAAALLAKQSSGVAVTAACVVLAVVGISGLRKRLICGLVPLAAAGATFLLINWESGGSFWVWGWSIPRAAPLEPSRLDDLLTIWGLGLVPLALPVFYELVVALRRRTGDDLDWLAATLPVLFYTPLAVLASIKRLGGTNNLTLLWFLYGIIALPLWLRWSTGPSRLRALAPIALVGMVLAVWSPKKRTPIAIDHRHGQLICDVVRTAQECGEKIWAPRGVVCLDRAGVLMPRDRMMSIYELVVAERVPGIIGRLERGEYDLVVISGFDMLHPYVVTVIRVLMANYVKLTVIPKGQKGDLFSQGWGEIGWPVMVLERRSEQGSHPARDGRIGCRGATELR